MSPNNLKQQLQAIPIPPDIRQRSQIGIEQAVLEQQESNKHRKKSRVKWMTAIVAAIALLCLSVDFMSHNYVWAAIQRALHFVPGIGIVKEDDSLSERYILKQPITLRVGEGSISINGFLSDEEMTYITMVGDHTPKPETITLINDQGVEYTVNGSMSMTTLTEWRSEFWHKGKLDVSGDITMVINYNPQIEVPVTLMRAETYSSYSEMGETNTLNGVSITAIPDRVGEKARISFVARHSEDFRISDYGIHGVYMHDESLKLNVIDDSGQKLEVENIRGMSSPASEFYFILSEKARNRFTLILPEISVNYNSAASIKILTETQEHLNQTLEIAGFPITITKIEKVQENRLRIYMDFHYNEQAAASLYKVNIDMSHMAKLNERTGAIEYIEFDIEPNSKQVKLKLTKPEVILRGPWKFELSEDYFKRGN